MSDVIVGLDVGGTKCAIVVETLAGEPVGQYEVPSTDWDAEPIGSGAAWIAAAVASTVPTQHRIVALGVGAQGLDTKEISIEFATALEDLGLTAIAVNDAALLVPAAGFETGMGIISGTGAIAVGRDSSGDPVITGGWGWVIGDEAGAAGIVREATKAALLAHDDGVSDDGLLGRLLAAFGVDSAERLARAVNDVPTMDNWGPHAGAVFEAADAGSELAIDIVDEAAAHLARLVTQLRRRGATGTDVVASGGVIVNQPRLFDATRVAIEREHPDLTVHLLERPPVMGALALARTLAAAT